VGKVTGIAHHDFMSTFRLDPLLSELLMDLGAAGADCGLRGIVAWPDRTTCDTRLTARHEFASPNAAED
jgi:hypothetical protein